MEKQVKGVIDPLVLAIIVSCVAAVVIMKVVFHGNETPTEKLIEQSLEEVIEQEVTKG